MGHWIYCQNISRRWNYCIQTYLSSIQHKTLLRGYYIVYLNLTCVTIWNAMATSLRCYEQGWARSWCTCLVQHPTTRGWCVALGDMEPWPTWHGNRQFAILGCGRACAPMLPSSINVVKLPPSTILHSSIGGEKYCYYITTNVWNFKANVD